VNFGLSYLPYLRRFYAPADARSAFIAVRDAAAAFGGHIVAIPRDNLPVLAKAGSSDPLWSIEDEWTPVTTYRRHDGASVAVLTVGAPSYMAGAATNPDPDVFAFAAATVKTCLDATRRLEGENYVLWGGREGYETLLNTDMRRELDQLGRFMNLVVDYKHRIGFTGTILIEPKPQEPTKHQYDFDVASVYAFLKRYGLEREIKVNIEHGHAVLAGHSFDHEIALANALGIFGSIDMNRNDYQSGWDTDQFPNNVLDTALAYYQILRGGGFTTGGTNFGVGFRPCA